MSHTLSFTIFFLILSGAFALTPVAGRDCPTIHNCDDCARWNDCVWCEDFDTCQFSDTYSCRDPDFNVASCPNNRLAVGVIVGVVVGGFFLVMCIIGIVFLCRRNRDNAYAQPAIMTPAYPTPATVVYTGQQQPPMGQPIAYNAQGQPMMSPQYGQPNYGAPVYGAQPTYAQSPQPFAGQPYQMGQPPVYSPQPQPQQQQPPQQQQQPFVGQPHQMGQQPYAQQTQPGY